MVLGEMDVARVNLYRSGQGAPSALGLVRTPPANGGHPIPEGDKKSATYQVDDVHQARMAKGVWGSGVTGEDKRGIGW